MNASYSLIKPAYSKLYDNSKYLFKRLENYEYQKP